MKWRHIGVRAPRFRAAVVMALSAVCSLLIGALLAACSGGTSARPVSAVTSEASAASISPSITVTSATAPPARPTPRPSPTSLPVDPGAGRLEQTQAFPSTKTVAFHNAMQDLWLAVTTGKPDFALPAFFPERAYEQLKAIASPQSDWQNRLWYDFTLDVTAAHKLVGEGAKLVRVIVPNDYAAWVAPGGCYNSIGYWHAPGARVVYRVGSQVRSFGIASLISWRGDWYVVHFGAVLRSGDYGEVDEPTDGTGYTGPPGGC